MGHPCNLDQSQKPVPLYVVWMDGKRAGQRVGPGRPTAQDHMWARFVHARCKRCPCKWKLRAPQEVHVDSDPSVFQKVESFHMQIKDGKLQLCPCTRKTLSMDPVGSGEPCLVLETGFLGLTRPGRELLLALSLPLREPGLSGEDAGEHPPLTPPPSFPVPA